MALKQQQDLLARLYTDQEFRNGFLADPVQHASRFGLTLSEAEEAGRIAVEELAWFSESLLKKRMHEAAKQLPLSVRFLGEEFEPTFREFAKSFNPVGVKKHLEDALAFAERLTSNRETDPVCRDILKFESSRLRHFNENRILTVCLLRHDLRPLIHASEHSAAVPLKRNSVVIWIKTGRTSRFLTVKL